MADTGRIKLDEYVRWPYTCCQRLSNLLGSLLIHTTFRDWNILNLDVKVRAFVDHYTSFTCFWDVKSLDLVFCHIAGICVLIGLIDGLDTVALGMKSRDLEIESQTARGTTVDEPLYIILPLNPRNPQLLFAL